MGGHLFVLRGDLTKLQCSAILVPCDANWQLVWEHWSELLTWKQFEDAQPYGAQLRRRPTSGRFHDVNPSRGRRVRLVVTANGGNDARWVTEGVVEAIEDFASELKPVAGRVEPLVALPLVGTGEGGFQTQRGLLINALIRGLGWVAGTTAIDVALVLLDERDHAAIQHERTGGNWTEISPEHLPIADELGARAARGELSLFLGAGVSVPLGLPDWKGLLEEIGGESLPEHSPESAPETAQKIANRIGIDNLHAQVARSMKVEGVAPAHLLLAGLGVRQTVTTNFDTAYETALDGIHGTRNYRVLTQELAIQPDPWVLKLHGDACRPESIVITSSDYERLNKVHRSLHAVVESLLMTSHLMFVGYSMGEEEFLEVAKRVHTVRELADKNDGEHFATVLALHPGTVREQTGFSMIPMLDGDDRLAAQAARHLEIFLDRISWAAARQSQRSHAFLLDSNYDDLFADQPETLRLRHVLDVFIEGLPNDDPARKSRGWVHVENMLTSLGQRKLLSDNTSNRQA